MGLPTVPLDVSQQLAVDAKALGNLRAQARNAPADAVGKVAVQFETLFVQTLMKQMRDTLPRDGLLSSETTRSYEAMYDQQIAQQLASRGVGLRKVIEQYLSRQLGQAASATDPAGTGGAGSAPAPTPSGAAVAPTPTAAPALPRGTTASPTAGVAATVESFVARFRTQAEAAARTAGVPAEYLLGQAALETGWGRSIPVEAGGRTSYNLFGMKAGATWKGAVADAPTTEVVAGRETRINARFRSYGSFGDAFQDLASLLRTSGRYSGAVARAGTARGYAEGLQRAGYATDPQYADKLVRVIELVSRARQPAVARGPGQDAGGGPAAMAG